MLLMAGLMLADKTAGVEDRLREAEARAAELAARVEELREPARARAAQRVEVPVVPPEVTEHLAEIAARAEALADRRGALRSVRAAGLLALAAAPALAEPELRRIDYACDRGARIEAAYSTGRHAASGALTLEGRMIGLDAEATGAEVRYGWPSDGSGYVWLLEGGAATLLWSNGPNSPNPPARVLSAAGPLAPHLARNTPG